MLETLISSKTRIKLLLRFFLNPDSNAYLRGLAEEFNESTNAIRLELNRLEESGMLQSVMQGNRKVFRANTKHPIFSEVRQLVMKHTGLQQIINRVIKRLGNIQEVYLTGDMALGLPSDEVNLIIIGNPDEDYLTSLVNRVKRMISKKINYTLFSKAQASGQNFDTKGFLLLWNG